MIHPRHAVRGFTLIEIILALAASAILLAAIYGLFSRAVKLRDRATERTREVRVQMHAVSVIRNDLRNALISGGLLAATLQGSRESRGQGFPGYLKFTATTARDAGADPVGDVQQIEYYIVTDPKAENSKAGQLVRAVDRNILAPVRETPPEEPLLVGVESMEVDFYDGGSWQESWGITEEELTLPEAVRVRLQPAAAADAVPGTVIPAIEILVPWTTQAAIEAPAAAATPPATGGNP